MIRVGVVGPGQDGPVPPVDRSTPIPDVELVGVCDSTGYLPRRARQVHRAGDVHRLSSRCSTEVELDAVVIATPSQLHAPHGARRRSSAACTCSARSRSASTPAESDELTAAGRERGPGHPGRLPLPLRRRLRARSSGCSTPGAIGRVTHVLAEAYGPVVLKPQGSTWRSQKQRGRRLPLRLRRPSAQPAQLVPRRADRCRRHRARPGLLARDRRRGRSRPCTSRAGAPPSCR